MNEAFWALGRATGVVALALTTLALLLGVVNRSGRPLLGLPRFSVALVHRNVALLSAIFIVIHMLSLLGDSYAQLTLVDLVVPFLGAADPVWLGLGTASVDLLLAVVITALLRTRIGFRAFRAVHWLTYLLWPVAFLHSVGMGSDAGAAWFLAVTVICSGFVVGAVAWRLSANFIEYRNARVGEHT